MSDELIKKLIETAEKKEKEIGRIQSYENKTNLSFPYDESSNRERKNLNVVNEPKELVSALAFLISRKGDYENAAKELSAPVEFSWGGFSYEDWLHDIKNRVDVIALREKKKELKEIRAQLDELMSPDMKRNLKLEEIKQKLGV